MIHWDVIDTEFQQLTWFPGHYQVNWSLQQSILICVYIYLIDFLFHQIIIQYDINITGLGKDLALIATNWFGFTWFVLISSVIRFFLAIMIDPSSDLYAVYRGRWSSLVKFEGERLKEKFLYCCQLWSDISLSC